jgi:phosphoribosylaminoimidazole-succinocarboxamide synthase
MVIVTTDRQSAFDRILASVPFKGQVLNQTSKCSPAKVRGGHCLWVLYWDYMAIPISGAWWMKNTTHIVKNALLGTPDPNVSVMRKCDVFPVEFVCRGFMTGLFYKNLFFCLHMV